MEISNALENVVLVVSAPSGGGKTSICREFLKAYPDVYFSVSSTTRSPRPGEVDGRDYRFIARGEFEEKIEQGAFLEWAENFGHYYGTPREEVDRMLLRGRDVLFDVDPRGAKSLRARFPDGVFIFILPPSLEVLEERLSGRGSEDRQALNLRVSRAMDEIQESVWYNYVIFNEHLKTSIDAMKSVYVAEKIRVKRQGKRLRPFLKK